MDDRLCCARCKEPLKIVCDAHGTEWVPDRRVNTVPAPGALSFADVPYQSFRPRMPASSAAAITAPPAHVAPEPIVRRQKPPRVARRPRPGTKRDEMYQLVSRDRAHPSSAQVLIDGLGLNAFEAASQLSALSKEGYLERVARGLYIQRQYEDEADAVV